MVHRFGSRDTFAIELGEVEAASRSRVVDLWGAGLDLSCDDHDVYLPQFCKSMAGTIATIERSVPSGEVDPEEMHRRLYAGDWEARLPFRFVSGWGPTTDNVRSLFFRTGADAILTFEFWRPGHVRPDELGKVFVATLPAARLIADLRAAVDVLRAGG